MFRSSHAIGLAPPRDAADARRLRRRARAPKGRPIVAPPGVTDLGGAGQTPGERTLTPFPSPTGRGAPSAEGTWAAHAG